MAKQATSAEIYRRLLTYIKPYWYALVIAIVGNAFYAGVDSFSAYLIKPIINKGVIASDPSFIKLIPYYLVGLVVLRGLGGFLAAYFMGYASNRLVLDFQKLVFRKLLSLPACFYDTTTSGRLLGVLTYNVNQLTQAGGEVLTTLIRQSFYLTFLFGVMLYMSWWITLLAFIVTPFLIITVRYVSRRFRRLARRIQSTIGSFTHVAEETLVSYRDVRLYHGQKIQEEKFFRLLTYNFHQQMKCIVTQAVSSPIIQLLVAIMLAIVVHFALKEVTLHHMTFGSFASLVGAMAMLAKPARSLSKVNNSIQNGLAAAESVFTLLDEPSEPDVGTKKPKSVKGAFSLQNISFSYPASDKEVLTNVSLDIPAAKVTALVGPSGGGKSTLASLIARFYQPTDGDILLDGTPIEAIDLHAFRQKIAFVSQHVTLFNDTLHNNIAYGEMRGASKEKVIAAAKAANAWDFIQAFPEGLDTMLGENGLNLSGGQRQRVAIARAILRDAPILILDEATSALDNESERLIQTALDSLKVGRTSIVIAHRLSTIEQADQIVVIENGSIIEKGTHASLIKQGGRYAKLQRSALFK